MRTVAGLLVRNDVLYSFNPDSVHCMWHRRQLLGVWVVFGVATRITETV